MGSEYGMVALCVVFGAIVVFAVAHLPRYFAPDGCKERRRIVGLCWATCGLAVLFWPVAAVTWGIAWYLALAEPGAKAAPAGPLSAADLRRMADELENG